MGRNKDSLRKVEVFSNPELFPEISLAQSSKGSGTLTVALKNQGGGIGKVRVLVNGKEIVTDARGPKPDPAVREASLSVDLSGAALIPGQENKVEVIAWNADGYLSSRGRVLMIKAPETK